MSLNDSNVSENQHVLTNFALFCQKNPVLVENLRISYRFRIVYQKQFQFGRESTDFLPFSYCFSETIPIW